MIRKQRYKDRKSGTSSFNFSSSKLKLIEAIKKEWTSLFKTGEPSSDGGWVEYTLENNENTFFISQNGKSEVTLENRDGLEVSKALRFWDTEWNWDWKPF